LEIGPGYVDQTGESGIWMHYRKGYRDPVTGHYSVDFWRQRVWVNNKGPLLIEPAGVRVFAFREQPVAGTPYSVVAPDWITEITDSAKVEAWNTANQGPRVRVTVSGTGATGIGPLDRVLVVQHYRTPEMDYFSDSARPYLRKLVDTYADAGVKLNALYADETHIQQDWGYFGHHDNGEFAVRYVSPGLQKRFAEAYGAGYADFAKYMVYFVHGQNDFSHDAWAKSGAMHVLGASPEDIRRTALLRSRYYSMLQNGVVDLFLEAKEHLEERMGHRLHSRAHATWAESPTIDLWDSGPENGFSHQYEYTSNFIWSNTVHQAAAACHDYFRWGDFLHGTGNDTAECGWLDRNFTGFSQACSLGILNDFPNAYAAHWGMPAEISRRRQALSNAFGTAPEAPCAIVQDLEHRDVDVLMLYPLDLVAAEERFGSWMTQYGYANFVTQAKLLEAGRVENGAVVLGGRRFTTLVALFEPFPSTELITLMSSLVSSGGRLVWSGPPPVIMTDGTPVGEAWNTLTGAGYTPTPNDGLLAPGRKVEFAGRLVDLEPMVVLTDFLVDRVYPVTVLDGTEVVATVKGETVGTHRALEGGGSVTYLGFRPRDDQAAALGYETSYWFDILSALGAYAPSGRFDYVNDNPEYLSRTTRYLFTQFPNGAVAAAPHLKHVEECWPGGFARKPEEDAKIIESLDLPSEEISLDDVAVAGHRVSYRGNRFVTFRNAADGTLLAFCGCGSDRITVDGVTTTFADNPMPLVAWAPVPEERRVAGGAVLLVCVYGPGTVRIPAAWLKGEVQVISEGRTQGSRGEVVPSHRDGDSLVFTATGRPWYYVVP
jgi:hypothetical protein